jgi:hypothetical protein
MVGACIQHRPALYLVSHVCLFPLFRAYQTAILLYKSTLFKILSFGQGSEDTSRPSKEKESNVAPTIANP